MMCIIIRFYLVVLLNSLFVISLAQIYNPGVCSNEDEPLQCCQNYKRRGNSCEECLPGTFGIDCEKDCPEGFYGRLCAEVCNCSSCDKVSGCQPNSTQTETTKQENSYNRGVIIASSLTGSLTFIIIVIVIYRKQSRNRILISPDSSIRKGGVLVKTTPLGGFPQLH
ncbi:multiple epidermal growth factor-like domains protein 10 [Ostrea edulis]|uniref:multiple epidermal growth factor-like domains protein 10 n=1 Tax=Ostrea edulis TaxID=37623 RepID=UPI0024AF6222|nr:multiple epidermal growth factor-like domains protein 10 [Ostrea edulis]XP_056006330.1 multiple epidermal growth factor-like domains protein 10 [Ostrea edulis]